MSRESDQSGHGEGLDPERRAAEPAHLDRRTLLKATAGGVAAALGATSRNPVGAAPAPASYQNERGFSVEPLEVVRMAFVGTGLQGGGHVQNFLRIDGVEIKAICDIDEARAEQVASWVEEAGQRGPELYTRGPEDWRRLLERDDVDLVFSATPWEWHVPVCVEAMKSGKHAAVEVPAAIDLDGCWQLVETAEGTERHCSMMENCNYGRREMMALNLVRRGLLGEILHAEAAYIHDLRAIKWGATNEGLWRWRHSIDRNANLYPTHGLGPVAQCMDINRGDQFDYLVSMSSPQRGITKYVEEHLAPDDPRRDYDYELGDMNSSLIKTRLGRTILLQHDTTTPRPYSRLNLVQGTEGTIAGYPDRVFLEARAEKHEWSDIEEYWEEFEHPLWKKLRSKAIGAGHGGMDYLEDYRLIEALRRGEPLDMDVYDAAALSAPIELTERSVANRSLPVDFPDFTRGRWKNRVRL